VEVLVKRVAHRAGAFVARVRDIISGVRSVALMTDGVGASASSSSSSFSAVVESLRGWLILAVLAVVRSRLVTASSLLSSSSSLSLSFFFNAFILWNNEAVVHYP
jgi:hypothetical protein